MHRDSLIRPRDERGVAMIVAILLLLLVSAIGLASVDRSGDEATTASHDRRNATTFYAADAGVQFGRNRIFEEPPVTAAFEIDVDAAQGALGAGQTVTVRSGRMADGSPQPLNNSNNDAPPSGFSINWGSGTGFYSRNTTFNVTALAPGGAAVELETRVAQTKGGLGSNR